ncbi:MAG: acetate--CoA ligase family protein, partial [Haloarculaceae archaeon]
HLHEEHDSLAFFVGGDNVIAVSAGLSTREYGSPPTFDVDADRVHEILANAAAAGRTSVGIEGTGILDAYGIPTPTGELVDSAGAAAEVADEIGDPVAMKVASPDVLHKSDAGAVRTNVDPADAASVYDDLRDRAANAAPDAEILGVLVQAQVDLEAGQETIVGVNRDAQFGPLVMFGLGGIFVEVFEDTTFRVAPLSPAEARAMTEGIQGAPLLRGARGRPELAVDDVVETIQRIAQLSTDVPAIEELDVNPLIATPDGVSAVDVRLTFDPDRL